MSSATEEGSGAGKAAALRKAKASQGWWVGPTDSLGIFADDKDDEGLGDMELDESASKQG